MLPDEELKEREKNCECGLKENGTWSEEVFDRFGCTCDYKKELSNAT